MPRAGRRRKLSRRNALRPHAYPDNCHAEVLDGSVRKSVAKRRDQIAPVNADAGTQGRARRLPRPFQQARNIVRAVLPISVHGYDPGRVR